MTKKIEGKRSYRYFKSFDFFYMGFINALAVVSFFLLFSVPSNKTLDDILKEENILVSYKTSAIISFLNFLNKRS
jgi:hypothetical protein